jgi:hypothetical protein
MLVYAKEKGANNHPKYKIVLEKRIEHLRLQSLQQGESFSEFIGQILEILVVLRQRELFGKRKGTHEQVAA